MRAGEVVLLMGPGGSGKSGLARRYYSLHEIVSLDQLRLQLTNDIADHSATPVAVELRRIILENRIRDGLATVVDSTNCVRGHRGPVLALARQYSRPTIAVVFHTPLQLCLDRQKWPSRVRCWPGQPNGRAVPEDVVRRMFADLSQVWNRMSLEVDCVVHVSPEGQDMVRVGDIATRPGEEIRWLRKLPAVPDASHLPWEVPFVR